MSGAWFDTNWLTPANGMLAGAAGAALGTLWYWRNRALARLREENEAVQTLSEEIFTARNAAELHSRLVHGLQTLFDVGAITIYSHNRAGNSLHAVAPSNATPQVAPLDVDRPAKGMLLSFRQKEALLLEDPQAYPCPILWLPMTAEGEVTGVLECRFAAFGRRPDSHARQSLQHLANQVAFALQLIEQRQLREDILRSERLGAAIELISGIAAEVKAPLDRIQSRTQLLLHTGGGDPKELAKQLAQDADHARSVLERLVSFGKGTPATAAQLDWNQLVRSLIAFRSDAWRLLILEPDVALTPQQLPVLGVRGQLEQSLLGLLIHAEQSLRQAGTKRLAITTAAMGGHGTFTIEFDAPLQEQGQSGEMEQEAMGLAVIRGILESHSGSMTVTNGRDNTRVEVRLPLAGPALMQPASLDMRTGPKRILTLVACVPDEEQRRRVLEVAARGGHRVVPAESAAETLELLERLRFDAVVSTGLLPDMTWAELMDRVRGLNCGFVLMETANAAIAAELPVWRPPFALDELESMLGRMAV